LAGAGAGRSQNIGKRAYAWSHREGEKDEGERFVAVLEIPPVISPETAVRLQIVKDSKSGYSK
jgi:hypothetical protein